MNIIGLCGSTGAGKDEAARRISGRRMESAMERHSDYLRSRLECNGREPIPANMSALFEANAKVLGYQWVAVDVVRSIWNRYQYVGCDGPWSVAIVGIRNVDEVAYYRREFAKSPRNTFFRLVAIVAPQETRFERIRNRGERPGEKGMSWEDFVAIERLNGNTGLREVMRLADARVLNTGTKEHLYERIDALL